MTQQSGGLKTPSSTEDLLAQITGQVRGSLSRMDKPAARVNLDQVLTERETALQQAIQAHNTKAAEEANRVLSADFEGLRQHEESSEKNFAQVVLDLKRGSVALNQEYKDILKPNAAEESKLLVVRGRLEKAKQKLTSVQTRFFVWNRPKAIARAHDEIQKAETALEEAEAEVKIIVYNRLSKADFADSIQGLHTVGQQAIEKMTARTQEIEEDLGIIRAQLGRSLKIKEEAGKALDTLGKELTAKQEEVVTAEQVLGTMTNGTADYAAQDTRVKQLNRELEDIRGRRNNAMILSDKKEDNCKILSEAEHSRMKQLSVHRAWITMLVADQEDRAVFAQSRLQTEKTMADQEIAENIQKVSREFDADTLSVLSAAGAASERRLVDMLDQQPAYAQRIHAILTASAQANAETLRRLEASVADYNNRHGIDIYQEFTSTHQQKAAA